APELYGCTNRRVIGGPTVHPCAGGAGIGGSVGAPGGRGRRALALQALAHTLMLTVVSSGDGKERPMSAMANRDGAFPGSGGTAESGRRSPEPGGPGGPGGPSGPVARSGE